MHTRQSVAEVPAHAQNTNPDNLDFIRLVLEGDPPPMYPERRGADGLLRHAHQCKALFGRRDWNCHRCVELELYSAPRKGWQHEYFARRFNQLQRKLPL